MSDFADVLALFTLVDEPSRIPALVESESAKPVVVLLHRQDREIRPSRSSTRDIALAIADAMAFQGKIVFDTSRADGQFKKTASNAKLRALRPDFAFTPMRDGLHDAVAWFVAHYEAARK